MSNFAFERPVGATADVTELDYIAALHQTDVQGGIRKDGSIQDTDISLFLSSRYGVNVTPEEVRDTILNGLGSTDGFMDMMQLVSLLMIPVLRQEQYVRELSEESGASKDENDLLVYTVEMLLHDVTGSRQPKPLTRTLLKQILQAYGEEALAENEEVINQMLKLAGATDGQRVLLDAKTFLKALTADVQQYDVENKNKLSTNFHDVMSDSSHPAHDLSLAETTETTPETPPPDNTNQRDNTKRQVGSINSLSGTKENGESESASDMTKKEKYFKLVTGHEENDHVPTVYTAPQVDNTADTFRSRPLVIFQWTFFVMSFQTYLIRVLNQEILNVECTEFDPRARWIDNAGAFFCTIALNVLKWTLIMLAMSAVGVLYFGFGGIGNNIECSKPIYPLVGTAISVLCVFLPPVLFDRSPDDPLQQQFLEVVTAVLGALAAALTLWHCMGLLMSKVSVLWIWFKRILVPEAIRTEYNLKQAATYKTRKLVNNALEVHRVKKQESVVPTHFGQALLNFAESTPEYKRVGGMRWTIQSIWNKSLFRREGVLFSGRMLSTNFIQFVVTFFILIGGIALTKSAVDTFEAQWDTINTYLDTVVSVDVDSAIVSAITDDASTQFTDFLTVITTPTCPNNTQDVPSCNDVSNISQCIPDDSSAFCTLLDYTNSGEEINATVQTLLLNASGLDTISIADAFADRIAMAVEDSIRLYFPTDRYMIVGPFAVAVAVAFLASFFISVVVVPSASATTLKFRSGVIPFVHDPKVKLLRIAPDQTAFLRGLMYWGCLFASILLGAVWGIIVFLFVWQVTAAAAQQITASLIGALTVIGLHILINRNIRKVAASAFYRKKPAIANLTVLVRECGLVALTQGFVVVRIIRLLLTTCFYIGRLDTPFLSTNVGRIGGYRVDGEPYMFQIDILQHEAHRHPFIETLGTMYLYKLRYKDSFCTVAGSTWRLIFGYILFPWLSKYRALRRPHPTLKGDDEEDGATTPPVPAPPLRAVTLLDPQAYALRAVSLVPVASGWAGASINPRGRGGLSVMSKDPSLLRTSNSDDEVDELREENRKLRMQLRMAELSPATTTLNRGARQTPNSQETPHRDREVLQTNKPGFEVDSRGRIVHHPSPIPEDSEEERVRRPNGPKREESTGLSKLSPPKPRRSSDGPQVSWSDFGEFEM